MLLARHYDVSIAWQLFRFAGMSGFARMITHFSKYRAGVGLLNGGQVLGIPGRRWREEVMSAERVATHVQYFWFAKRGDRLPSL